MKTSRNIIEVNGEMLPLARLLKGPYVTLYVGQDPVPPAPLNASEQSRGAAGEGDEVEVEVFEYTIHSDLLCSSSKFFSLAFKGQMKEALSGKMHLPEETSENFNIFAEWLYTRRFPTNISAKRLLDIYFLADRYQVPELYEQCFHRFIDRYGVRVVPPDAILKSLLTRPHRRSTCLLHSYYVELYSYLILTKKKRARWIRALELDRSFAADVALEIARLQAGSDNDMLEHPMDRNRRERRKVAGARKRAADDSSEEDAPRRPRRRKRLEE